MFNNLSAYYHDHVVSSYAAYREISRDCVAGRSRDLREALNASSALFHFREYLPAGSLSRGQTELLCPDYALLGDVVNAAKHKVLTGKTPHGTPFIDSAASLGEEYIIIEYEDTDGTYTYAEKTVVVNLNDGSKRNIFEILTSVINFWEQHMFSIGELSEARVFCYHEPLRARTRAECEKNCLDFTAVQGQRFGGFSMRMLRFNNHTGTVEPIAPMGTKVKFSIYKPQFDIDLLLTNELTGKAFKKTITLSDLDSDEIYKLKSDGEKQEYINNSSNVKEAIELFKKEIRWEFQE